MLCLARNPMSRKRLNNNEIRIQRTITVSPSFWIRFKSWCRGRSMSEMLELSALRIMDEKNDALSLTQQLEELNQDISEKKYDYKKLQVDIENDEHSRTVLQDRLIEIKSSDKAIKNQIAKDKDWMIYFRDDNLYKIKRGWSKWMHEDKPFAAYMPSIDSVKERTALLDGMNPKETKMAWISLKYVEEDWPMWLKQEMVI